MTTEIALVVGAVSFLWVARQYAPPSARMWADSVWRAGAEEMQKPETVKAAGRAIALAAMGIGGGVFAARMAPYAGQALVAQFAQVETVNAVDTTAYSLPTPADTFTATADTASVEKVRAEVRPTKYEAILAARETATEEQQRRIDAVQFHIEVADLGDVCGQSQEAIDALYEEVVR